MRVEKEKGSSGSSRFKIPFVALTALLLIFFLRGIGLISVLPPLEMWDEYSHVAYVDYWSENHRPAVYGQTRLSKEFLAAVAEWPQPESAEFGQQYAEFWSGRPPHPLPEPPRMYEAQHPFFYYCIATPIYIAGGGRRNLPAAVSALRLVNLGFGTLAVALLLGWLFRNLKPEKAAMIGV